MRLFKGTVIFIAIVMGLLAACDSENESNEAGDLPTIAQIVGETENFSTLATALETASLVETFDGEGDFTVFAPTNAAFEALPDGALDVVLEDTDKLTKILQQHVILDRLGSDQVLASSKLTSMFGQDLAIDAGSLTIDGVQISQTDVRASNGTIHVIDAVLVPRDVVQEAVYRGFSTLADTLVVTELNSLLADPNGPYTVFAPTNQAFADLGDALAPLLEEEGQDDLVAILQNHVVSGEVDAGTVVGLTEAETLGGAVSVSVSSGVVSVNGNSKVTVTDIRALNGIIHVIDKVILEE